MSNLIDELPIQKGYKGFVRKLTSIFYEFSLFERVIVCVSAIALVTAAFSALIKLNSQFTYEIPKDGGELHEGMIGSPRFVNPVLATADTDRDLTALLYSGLLRLNADGELIADLAESYTISEDGLSYYFKIRDDATFHDGTPVTADDVIFTILKIQDPMIKSPKRPNWDSVRVEKISDKEVEFYLSTPYSPFIYNTTLGILPHDRWQNISPEEFPFSSLNTNPIGSGPYELDTIRTDETERITTYELRSFNDYTIKKPYITKIFVQFFKTEDELISAFNKKIITSMHSISPRKIEDLTLKKEHVIALPYSRIFALFFNQNKSALLTDRSLRSILDTTIDRQDIVDSVLAGYGSPLYSPLTLYTDITLSEQEFGIEAGKTQLATLGDKYQTSTDTEDSTKQKISFSIATANVPELVEVGQKIIDAYTALGAEVTLDIHEVNDLTSSVIRPREYDAILFGNVINRDLDYYSFWHSSQRNDPGLNLASYTSIAADLALEQARGTMDTNEKIALLQKFEKEVINDVPAVFLYSPDFIYLAPTIIQARFPKIIITPSDRFAEVYDWYTETEKVWKIFVK